MNPFLLGIPAEPDTERRRMRLNILTSKLRDVMFAVLPISIMVLILNFTISPMDGVLIIRFLIGTFLIIIGLSVFLVGADIGIEPIGSSLGSSIAKSNKIWVVAAAGLLLGFFISIAEPDLHILAGQADFATSGEISKLAVVLVVSVGVAVMLSIGLLRIVKNIPLYKLLTVLYLITFVLGIFTSPEFLAISFDASGATTGAMTVPFVLALAMGVSSLKKDREASENDSFGLLAIASNGAIVAVMVMSIISKTTGITAGIQYDEVVSGSILGPFIQIIPTTFFEVLLALLPITLIYLFFKNRLFKLSKRAIHKVFAGLIFTFLGLILFLVGVNAGFLQVGRMVGYNIASMDNKAYIIVAGFIFGFITILAEPAVYVLTHQIENVTSGYVKRKTVMISLSIGVGVAVALSTLRIIVPGIQLWHYLLPGYIISIVMSHMVPDLFVGIAFDSGGVASGPMTATFILAFAQGAASAVDGANVLLDGFGVIAMVALTPLIALQILGLIYKAKSKRAKVEEHG